MQQNFQSHRIKFNPSMAPPDINNYLILASSDEMKFEKSLKNNEDKPLKSLKRSSTGIEKFSPYL